MFAKHPDDRDIPALRQLWQEAFGDDDAFLDKFFATGYSENRCRVVMQEGQAAAVLYWFDCQWESKKLAYLYAVATHPEYRGRGLCHQLMARTHEELCARGYAGVILVPQEEALRKLYGSMGYKNATTVSEITAVPGETALPMEKIGAEAYARLRRQYLPRGGLRQEGESIAFLETYAAFYAGEAFLLAAYREADFLWGMELLGNREAAPGILKALGCIRGKFRTPGEELPFAMFLPLKEEALVPSYLGHAFD